MLKGMMKTGEDISGKHGFDEPDGSPSSHFAETQTRGETLNLQLVSEGLRGKVLTLRLRLKAEPKRRVHERELSRGV
jgi:hypothetical protein